MSEALASLCERLEERLVPAARQSADDFRRQYCYIEEVNDRGAQTVPRFSHVSTAQCIMKPCVRVQVLKMGACMHSTYTCPLPSALMEPCIVCLTGGRGPQRAQEVAAGAL